MTTKTKTKRGHHEGTGNGEHADEEDSETVDVEAVEKDAFKGLIKGKSIITVDGEKRWSKKKQFRAEIKEVFGGKDRDCGGFRSFTIKKDVTGGLKMKRVIWLNGEIEDKNDEFRRSKPRRGTAASSTKNGKKK